MNLQTYGMNIMPIQKFLVSCLKTRKTKEFKSNLNADLADCANKTDHYVTKISENLPNPFDPRSKNQKNIT